MIRTSDLKKLYQTDEIETTALDNVNIEVEDGEFVAVMGPSGCGKSTLLNILGLLDAPSEGEYFFQGKMTSEFTEKERAAMRKGNIGFVFQSFNLIEELSVIENIELPLMYIGLSTKMRRKMAEEALDKMNMMARRDHFPQQLSGGQQQRVAIARAVVADADLILADEPTGNLDSDNGDHVMNLLSELNDQGTTIVMVTHSPHDAQFANRKIHLFDGAVVQEPASKDFHV